MATTTDIEQSAAPGIPVPWRINFIEQNYPSLIKVSHYTTFLIGCIAVSDEQLLEKAISLGYICIRLVVRI